MPELGSKISLISKADIRYEGRLFTVDPQECTIALASVRSFGTEDRETQYPVAPQSQVYDYILFRGSDIKDIRVLNNVPSMPNDPAIMQMSVPPTLGTGPAPGQYVGQFNHPVVGQTPYPQYHPMAGFPSGVHNQLNKTSSMLDLIGGGSQQNASRSGTPAVGVHRKSPTADQSIQVGTGAGSSGQQRDSRRGSNNTAQQQQQQQQQQQKGQQRNRTNSRNRQRFPSGTNQQQPHQPLQQQQQQQPQQQNMQHQPRPQHHNHQGFFDGQNFNRGGWRGRPRGRGRGGFIPRNKNTLKFDNDYDFEQANTEFEELRNQLAKTKISEGDVKVEGTVEVDKKDDSGNETGAGEPEVEEDSSFTGYDKTKSFFDNISCEAVERSKGRSQRTDWRTERKLNSETFGVASARRGAWRPRASWRHPAHHNQHNQHNQQYAHHHYQQQHAWRSNRGARSRPSTSTAAPEQSAPAK